MSSEERYLIVFEGIDGSGKDTQLDALASILRRDNDFYGDKYSNIFITREPTKTTEPGRRISQLLKTSEVSPEEAAEYFIADRIIHSKDIRWCLGISDVLCSRFDLSTYAYQMVQGVDFEKLYEMHKYGPEGSLVPEVTLFFDLPARAAIERITGRSSANEYFETHSFLVQIENMYHEASELLVERDGRNIIRIDANQPINKVTEEMLSKLRPYLK